jgi:phage terminase large subunit-like protein
MSANWPRAVAKLIEDKANGPAVINMLSTELSGIIPVNPQGGKLSRLNAVSPVIEAGNVYLPENDEWVQDFLDEFAAATPDGGGQFWDQIDATTQALMRLHRPSRQLTFGRRPMGNVVPLDGSRPAQLTFGRNKKRGSVHVFGGRKRSA